MPSAPPAASTSPSVEPRCRPEWYRPSGSTASTSPRAFAAARRRKATEPFSYFDKGTTAIVGKNAGIAEMSERFGGFAMRGFAMRGFLGWLAWLFLHLVYLPGHRNRLGAFVTWAYEYLTSDRHARLITDMVASPAERACRAGRIPREPTHVRLVGPTDA